MKYFKTACILASASLFASGCAYENHALSLEQGALQQDDGKISIETTRWKDRKSLHSTSALLTKPVANTAVFALHLSDGYKALGDRAARNRDRATIALVSLAGAAALANAASVGAAEIAGTLAVGAAINEGAKIANSGGASQSFYLVSEGMACSSSAILAAFPDMTEGQAPVDVRATSIALLYIRRMELLLRSELQRDLPDLSDLTVSLGLADEPKVRTAFGENVSAPKMQIELMEKGLKECLEFAVKNSRSSREDSSTLGDPPNTEEETQVDTADVDTEAPEPTSPPTSN